MRRVSMAPSPVALRAAVPLPRLMKWMEQEKPAGRGRVEDKLPRRDAYVHLGRPLESVGI